ncbi:MAG: DUF58 domain-containing protein [Fibrobacterota bacterium]
MITRKLLKKVRRIELRTRSVVEEIFSGAYHSVFKGQGMEFAEVREYYPGDDVRSIDWNVTARMRAPYVKKYEEERELTIMIAVDASGSGIFGSKTKMKGEAAAELCALLALSAIKNNDRVGLIIFTSGIEKFIPPQKGRNHVLRLIRELLYFRPLKKGTDVCSALDYFAGVIKKKSIFFLISDFISPPFEKKLRAVSGKHDVIAMCVRDPREFQIPDAGFVELEDSETGEEVLVDTSSEEFRTVFYRETKKQFETLRNLFKRTRTDFLEISPEGDFTEVIVKYFARRKKERR